MQHIFPLSSYLFSPVLCPFAQCPVESAWGNGQGPLDKAKERVKMNPSYDEVCQEFKHNAWQLGNCFRFK